MLAKFACLSLIHSSLAAAPWDQGSHKLATFNEGNIILHEGAGMGVKVWTPKEAGEYPVMVFATGFGGDAPSFAYANILEHVASYGYIIVSVDQLKYPQPSKYVDTMTKAIDYLDVNLTQLLKAHGHAKVTYDFEKAFALGAQSSGNHMTVSYLNNTCGKAKALLMIDPVDGADPFGIVKNFIINPGTPVNFKIPAIMLDNGLDPTRAGIDPACAPGKLSNDRFYNAWNAPIWGVNATAWGHVDCLNAEIARVGKLLCPGHGGDLTPYHTHLGGLSVAFLDAVFRQQSKYLDLLEDASGMPVDSLVKHDLHGMDRKVTPYCIHN